MSQRSRANSSSVDMVANAAVGDKVEGEAVTIDGVDVDSILVGKSNGKALGDVGTCDCDGAFNGLTVVVGI